MYPISNEEDLKLAALSLSQHHSCSTYRVQRLQNAYEHKLAANLFLHCLFHWAALLAWIGCHMISVWLVSAYTAGNDLHA